MSFLIRLLFTMLVAVASPVHAQTWPTRPVRLIVPFPAGGAADIVARTIGDKLAARWGQPVVIDHRPGAGGTIATTELVKSAGDHTLMIGTLGTHAVAPSLYRNLPYDPQRDVVPVAMLMQTPMVAVASPTLPVRTLAEFVALAKANPGRYSYASPGNGTLNHLMGEMFKQAAGIDIEHVPYKSGTHLDLIAGRIALLFDPLAQTLPQIAQGNMRALAISHASSALPGVPTFREAGFPREEVGLWFGLFAPSSMPPEIVRKVSTDAIAAVRSPEAVQRVESLSSQVAALPHETFATLYAAELIRWQRATTEFKVRID